MELTQHLYLKIGTNVRGPVSANVLHTMFRNKEIDSSAMFSFDGSKWASVTKLFSSKAAEKSYKKTGGSRKKPDPLKIQNNKKHLAEIPEMRKRVDRAAKILNRTFEFITYLGFALCSVVMSMAISLGLRWAVPQFNPLFLMALAVVPSILMAGVIAHSLGNGYIKLLTKLSLKEKYSLAIHVPWENSPEEWPVALKKWLYCGDWLVENDSADLMPYVRAFVTGKTPGSVEEEVDLWQSIIQGNKKRFNASVGHSVRELAYLERLPAWTSEITPGMNLSELEKSLGAAGRKWAVSLFKRAAARRADLREVAELGSMDDVIFEFFCNKLPNGRECLMVIISSGLLRNTGEKRTKAGKKVRAA